MTNGTLDPATLRAGLETDLLFEHRLEIFSLILGPGRYDATLLDHEGCGALSPVLRGRLCQELGKRPGRHLEAGQHLYRMGNPARSIFLIQTGLIKTAAISPGGEERTLRLHKPGDVVGELCLCGGGRNDEAVALEASTVAEIPLETLLTQVKRDPEMALELASLACDRLADAYEQVESLSWDTVLHRLVKTLLRLAHELGEPAGTGTTLAHYISQDELARLVGARREVVSGLLNRLRDSGHISYSSRGPITVFPSVLQRFLDAGAGA